MTNAVAMLMSNRDCSDDRDRVYSVLALTTSPYTMLSDYNNTVAEVYTIFTRKYSPNSQLFGAGLCRRQNQPRPEQETNSAESRQPIDIGDRNYLPSWVPEFRPSLNLAWASPFAGRYSTAKAAPYFFRPHPEILNIMHVTGTIFDVIYKATWEYPDKGNALHLAFEPGFYFSIIDEIQNLQLSLLNTSAELNPVSEPSWLILAKALTAGVSEFEHAEYMLSRYPHFQSLAALGPGSLPWLTAIWNQFEAHCLSPTGEVFQQILLETLGGKPKSLSTDGEIALGFLNYIANILDTNRLFTTRGRYLGLAPKGTRIGDFIIVVNGLDTPYVVRSAGKVKYKDPKGGGQETENDLDKPRPVQVNGPCYLHGIMNGEIFANRDAPQFSHLSWTRYDGDKVDSLEGGLALI
ncbi:hypothetical protein NPX13_g4382 [Xylaria arbuscula]|uniref:Uncharacterized protein n=1 Tax=Xylaria arbuscula TaxID=114810 RepID=A0A9W8TLZ9_9PEZI|nr:hypothetical protein NPX13_g4382 [Xylaria arbuscula]